VVLVLVIEMIAYESGIHDGNAHNHEDLPILVVGGGSGTLKTYWQIDCPQSFGALGLVGR